MLIIDIFPELLKATGETLYMTLVSGTVATLIGLPLGLLLFVSRKNGVLENTILNNVLSLSINILRSIPFIILLVVLIPVTRLIIGSAIGTNAAIVPLCIAAVPFMARLVESFLEELPIGLGEMGLAIGATPWETITRILLPEAMPGIVNSITSVLINLIGYTAMAGAVGGGGLGDLAIRYGYQRFDTSVILATVAILIFLVQTVQYSGNFIVRKLICQ